MSFCVHCGCRLGDQNTFGETYLCTTCVPRCELCGISLFKTERAGDVCKTCSDAWKKQKKNCVGCGVHLEHTDKQYKIAGNFCMRCHVTAVEASRNKETRTTSILLLFDKKWAWCYIVWVKPRVFTCSHKPPQGGLWVLTLANVTKMCGL